jgi:hypothetical protein
MVWHYNIPVILMVTNEWESGRQKCHRYWPEPNGATARDTQDYGLYMRVKHIVTERHALWLVRWPIPPLHRLMWGSWAKQTEAAT